MGKKFLIYTLIFFGLIFLNFYLALIIQKNFSRQAAIERILAEIDENNSPINQFSLSSAPFDTKGIKTDVKLTDGRAANLKIFFRKYYSPLYDYAELIVQESDRNGFDYRLLPAIAMQESSLCLKIPADSHNCWGWGIYGDTITKFSSYDEAIVAVSKGLKEEYLDKGYVTASRIMAKYTPSSPGSWAYAVNKILRDLE